MRLRTFNFRQALIVDFSDLRCEARKAGVTIYTQLKSEIAMYSIYMENREAGGEMPQLLQNAEPFVTASASFLLRVYKDLRLKAEIAGDFSDEAVIAHFEALLASSRVMEGVHYV